MSSHTPPSTVFLALERQSHELLQALPAAIYVTDAAGRITFYNEAAAALWGCRPELGKSEFSDFWKLLSPDGTPFVERLKKLYPPRPNAVWAVGENLYASSVEPTAADAIKAWLSSPPHRGILLSGQYRDLGLGIVRAAAAGGDFGGQPTWVVTADFGARLVQR